ncbi:MAG: hypothetical protein ACEPO8_15195 [Rhodothermaceae bacterium]
MVIDLVITKTDEGYDAEIPSLAGCESWAHKEEEVIEKSLELVRFYLNIPVDEEIKVDKAYKREGSEIYKLVFEKR